MSQFQVNIKISTSFYKGGDLIETEAGHLRVLAIEAGSMSAAVQLAQLWADGIESAHGSAVTQIISAFTWRDDFGPFLVDIQIQE